MVARPRWTRNCGPPCPLSRPRLPGAAPPHSTITVPRMPTSRWTEHAYAKVPGEENVTEKVPLLCNGDAPNAPVTSCSASPRQVQVTVPPAPTRMVRGPYALSVTTTVTLPPCGRGVAVGVGGGGAVAVAGCCVAGACDGVGVVVGSGATGVAVALAGVAVAVSGDAVAADGDGAVVSVRDGVSAGVGATSVGRTVARSAPLELPPQPAHSRAAHVTAKATKRADERTPPPARMDNGVSSREPRWLRRPPRWRTAPAPPPPGTSRRPCRARRCPRRCSGAAAHLPGR